MLCNGENPILKIVSVNHMGWESGAFAVAPRSHSALAFRIRGSATVRGGGREYNINANDVLYLPQGMAYTAEYTDTEMIVFHFITAQADEEIEVYSFENGETLYKLFLQGLSLWEKKEPGFAVYGMAQLYRILGALLEQQTRITLPSHFLQAVSRINADYRKSALSVDSVCAAAGIGATVFRRLFKEHYRKTPTEYITDLRLDYARTLIAGGAAVETAAYECGFNDPKYFARVVKKRFGCTPRALKTYGK